MKKIELPISTLKAEVKAAKLHGEVLDARAKELSNAQYRFFRKLLGAVAQEEVARALDERFEQETLAEWQRFAEAAWQGEYGEGVLLPVRKIFVEPGEKPFTLKRVIPLSDRGERLLESLQEGTYDLWRSHCAILATDGEKKSIQWWTDYDEHPAYDFVEVTLEGTTEEEYRQFWYTLDCRYCLNLSDRLDILPDGFQPPADGRVFHLGDGFLGIVLPSGKLAVGQYYEPEDDNNDPVKEFLGVADSLRWSIDKEDVETLRQPTLEEIAFLEGDLIQQSEDYYASVFAAPLLALQGGDSAM